jgi:hypothetical protein
MKRVVAAPRADVSQEGERIRRAAGSSRLAPEDDVDPAQMGRRRVRGREPCGASGGIVVSPEADEGVDGEDFALLGEEAVRVAPGVIVAVGEGEGGVGGEGVLGVLEEGDLRGRK